jgi:hypothetical protein
LILIKGEINIFFEMGQNKSIRRTSNNKANSNNESSDDLSNKIELIKPVYNNNNNNNNNNNATISNIKNEKNSYNSNKSKNNIDDEIDDEDEELKGINSHGIKYKSTKKRLKNHHTYSHGKNNINLNEINHNKQKYKTLMHNKQNEIELIVKKKLITTTTTTNSAEKESTVDQASISDNQNQTNQYYLSNNEQNINENAEILDLTISVDNNSCFKNINNIDDINKMENEKLNISADLKNIDDEDNPDKEKNINHAIDQNFNISANQSTIKKKQIEYEFRLKPKKSSNRFTSSKNVKHISFNSIKNSQIPTQLDETLNYDNQNCLAFLCNIFRIQNQYDLSNNSSNNNSSNNHNNNRNNLNNNSKSLIYNIKQAYSDNEIYQDKIIKLNKTTNIVIKTSPVHISHSLKRNNNFNKNMTDSTDTINNSKNLNDLNYSISNFRLILEYFLRFFCCCCGFSTSPRLIRRNQCNSDNDEYFYESDDQQQYGNRYRCCFKTHSKTSTVRSKNILNKFSSLKNETNKKSSDCSTSNKEKDLSNESNIAKSKTLNKTVNQLNESSSNSNLNSHYKLSVRHSAASADSSNDEYMDNPPIKCIRVLRPSNDLTSVRFDSHFNIIQAVNNGSQIDLSDTSESNDNNHSNYQN